MNNSTYSALSIIDGMIGHLARGGPGKEVVLFFESGKEPSYVSKYGSLLGLNKTTKKDHWNLTGRSAYDALFLTRSLLESLYDTIPVFCSFPVEDQLSFYLKAREYDPTYFVKYAKYITVWPMARYLQNDLPPKPFGFEGSPLVYSGGIKRFLKNRLISFNDRNTRIWLGYLQGVKRGAAVVSKDFIHDTMVTHRKAMSAIPSTEQERIDQYDTYVSRLANMKFKGNYKLHEASTSASFGSKRSEGGARGDILRYLHGSFPIKPNDLLNMVEVRPGKVVEQRGFIPPRLDDLLNDDLTAEERLEGFKALRSFDTDRDVMVSAVCEPLKVRLITKGNALSYYISRDFQKGMWGYLQKFPQFCLTGRPLSIMDLDNLLDRERSLEIPLDDPFWVSGDYSAATDGVDFRMTAKIFSSFLSANSDLPNELISTLWKVIGKQVINYPASMNRSGELDPVVQSNGQLMGSTLSFPILCIINLIAYWKALEEYMISKGCLGHTFDMKSLPVLINGDDILFRADKDLYTIWKRCIAEVGFNLSLGKNYIHKNILTINSKMFRYSCDKGVKTYKGVKIPYESHTFKPITYLNCGLLTGQSKVTGRDGQRLLPIWDIYNKIVPESINHERTHRRFIHYYKNQIESYTGSTGKKVGGNFNLFSAVPYGGLGFQWFLNGTPKYTSFQKRFASFLENKIKDQINQKIVPNINEMGLIRKNKSALNDIEFYHKINPVIEPEVGPHEKRFVSIEPKLLSKPILSFSMDPERPDYTVRYPSNSMKEFRLISKKVNKKSSKDMMIWPYKVMDDVKSFLPYCLVNT